MEAEDEGEEYKLSCTLTTADSEPVRSLSFTSCLDDDDAIQLLAGSQNGLLSVFQLKDENNECITMTPHDGSRPYAMASLLSLPCDDEENACYAAGSKDSHIRIYSCKDHSLLRTFSGHSKSVSSLSWLTLEDDDIGYLLSGSWDGTAKIWNVTTGACMATLPDHENTVSVLGLPCGRMVTSSAGMAENGAIVNHKIRMWHIACRNGNWNCQFHHTPSDNHSGPIRALAVTPADMILSCSNDGSVKMRTADQGECVQTLTVNDNESVPILLDVTCGDKGHVIAAAAEDGNLLLWSIHSNTNATLQRIPHPGCVWKVLFLPNGDVCTACQDGAVRVFTSDPSRFAPSEQIQLFEQLAHEAHRKTASGPTPEEIAKLPKWEMRSVITGRSEGQVQVFSRNEKAIAAQWNDSSKTWVEVGEVMGQNPNSGSIDGVSYDHVLPIEIDIPSGGLQKLQIGYNNGENPFVTAQKFIDDYMLDQNYLSQIADYIRQRVGDSAVQLGGAPSSTPASNDVTMDMTLPAFKQQKTYHHIPMKGYMSFEVPDIAKSLPKIINKIKELHTESSSTIVITPLESLQQTLTATSRYHSSTISMDELRVLEQCLTQWDLSNIFPVLDLLRITVLHPDAAKQEREAFWSNIIPLMLKKCNQVSSDSAPSKLIAAVPMLTLRVCSNCFKGGRGSSTAVISYLTSILSCVETFSSFSQSNKNLRLTLSTILLNAASCLNCSTSFPSASIEQLATQIISLVKIAIQKSSSSNENEALTRALVALGTTLLLEGAKATADLVPLLKSVQCTGKAALVVKEIYELME